MMWDAETEALRGELMQLSHSELLALAKQEGVHTAGRAAADIVDALLRMECAEDAAGKLAGSSCMPCCTLADAPAALAPTVC